ncbi:hypothetical protein GCM10010343_07620 [Streptomyces avidinii]|nr:hypothetical protein GCM10010343_07620 [Streptomyces avidinii]
MRAAQEAHVIPPIESSTAVIGPSCTVLLVMFRLQGDGRAVRDQYELAGTARQGSAGAAAGAVREGRAAQTCPANS